MLLGILYVPAVAVSGHEWRKTADELLPWVREHWLNAAAITAAATIALVIVPIVWRVRDRRHTEQTKEPPEPQPAKISADLRDRWIPLVRSVWIDRRLTPSLSGVQPLLPLRWRRRLDLSADRWDDRSSLVHDGYSILDVFNEPGRVLLIVGKPGSGKTTCLLQLAKALLDCADADSAAPIPVVLTLDSWTPGYGLAEWAASTYQDHQEAANQLLRRHVVLLLDDFAEVAKRYRAACVKVIIAFLRENTSARLVMTCQSSIAGDFPAQGAVEQVIELQPLADEANAYLSSIEGPSTPVGGTRARLAEDPELRELLGSPRMVQVIKATGPGQLAQAAQGQGKDAGWSAPLWEAYVTGVLRPRPLPGRLGDLLPRRGILREILHSIIPSLDYTWEQPGYTRQEARMWLEWLAHATRKHGQESFQPADVTAQWVSVDKPSNLPEQVLLSMASRRFRPATDWEPTLRKRMSRRRRATTIMLLAGLLTGLLIGILAHSHNDQFWGLAIAVALVFDWFLVAVLGWNLPGPPVRIRTLITEEDPALHKRASLYYDPDKPEKSEDLLTAARLLGPGWGLLGGFAAILAATQLAGLYWGLGCALIMWLGFEPLMTPAASTVYRGWALLRHYAVRGLLVWEGKAPWQYESFLDDMTDRVLLQRTGGGYQFAHLLLRDHLADRYDLTASRQVPTPASQQASPGHPQQEPSS